MVATMNLAKPTRMFARLTYTGEDKCQEPICCDLSRVATIAAANPLPRNLVNSVMPKKMEGKLDELSHDSVTSSETNSFVAGKKRGRPMSDDHEYNIVAKQPKTNERREIKRANKLQVTSLLAENEALKRQNEMLKNKVLTFQLILKKEENYQYALQKIRELEMNQNHLTQQQQIYRTTPVEIQ